MGSHVIVHTASSLAVDRLQQLTNIMACSGVDAVGVLSLCLSGGRGSALSWLSNGGGRRLRWLLLEGVSTRPACAVDVLPYAWLEYRHEVAAGCLYGRAVFPIRRLGDARAATSGVVVGCCYARRYATICHRRELLRKRLRVEALSRMLSEERARQTSPPIAGALSRPPSMLL